MSINCAQKLVFAEQNSIFLPWRLFQKFRGVNKAKLPSTGCRCRSFSTGKNLCSEQASFFCVCVCLPWWLPVACRLLSIICVLLDSARAKRISTKGWVYLSAERLMFDVSQRFHGEPSRAPAALQALLTWKYQTQTVHPTLCLPIPETRRRCFLTAGCPAVMMWGRKALRYNKGDGCFSEVKTVLKWNTPLGFRPSAQQAAGLPGVAPLPVLIGSTSKQYVLTRVFSWAQQTFQTLCYSLSVWVRY